MFHFVFKMFTVGAAALLKWGMQAVAHNNSVLIFNVAGLWNPYINVMESLP
jgi:hypothetical protein